MNKLTKKALRKATTVVRSIVGCTPNLFSLLVLVAVIVFNSAPAALAQGTPPGPKWCQAEWSNCRFVEQSTKQIIEDYDKRHPFRMLREKLIVTQAKFPGLTWISQTLVVQG